MAWFGSFQVARLGEGEWGEPADCGRAKPETVAEEMGLGTAAKSERGGARHRPWRSQLMPTYALLAATEP